MFAAVEEAIAVLLTFCATATRISIAGAMYGRVFSLLFELLAWIFGGCF